MDKLQALIDGLKQRLKQNKDKYVEQNDWNGDTECGFYTTYDFDFDKLIQEIDAFAAEFEEKNKGGQP